jgi:16S rRNA (guanine527-N7)-methyltransferase
LEIINKYFADIPKDQADLLAQLLPLYEEWNSKINVISRKDMDQFYCNHVLHSLSIARIASFTENDTVLDIGTGGGFPGIPLAILFPKTQFTLVDSILKKTKVVVGVMEALGLENMTVVNDRFENIEIPYSYVLSRAVAPALKLVTMTKKAMNANTKHIFIKGGDLAEEKRELLAKYKSLRWNEVELKDHFDEEFFETKKLVTLSNTLSK